MDKMGDACSTYGEEKRVQGLMGETRKRHLEDLGLDGRVILKCLIKKYDGRGRTGLIWLGIRTCGGWVHVNAVMNFRVP
jgi:hypothetical protein